MNFSSTHTSNGDRCSQDRDEGDSSATCHNFAKQALPHLVPLLLEQLTKQEEGQVRGDNTPPDTAACIVWAPVWADKSGVHGFGRLSSPESILR